MTKIIVRVLYPISFKTFYLTTGLMRVNSDFGCCIKDFTEDNNAGDKDDGSNNTSIEPMSAMRKTKI
jgi:hypothetical protein